MAKCMPSFHHGDLGLHILHPISWVKPRSDRRLCDTSERFIHIFDSAESFLHVVVDKRKEIADEKASGPDKSIHTGVQPPESGSAHVFVVCDAPTLPSVCATSGS